MSTDQRMSDEAVICEFMEPMPRERNPYLITPIPSGKWWIFDWYAMDWRQGILDLDALHEVEERLSEEKWVQYWDEIGKIHEEWSPYLWWKASIHATPAQKIAALAAVLRPEVER